MMENDRTVIIFKCWILQPSLRLMAPQRTLPGSTHDLLAGWGCWRSRSPTAWVPPSIFRSFHETSSYWGKTSIYGYLQLLGCCHSETHHLHPFGYSSPLIFRLRFIEIYFPQPRSSCSTGTRPFLEPGGGSRERTKFTACWSSMHSQTWKETGRSCVWISLFFFKISRFSISHWFLGRIRLHENGDGRHG
jgi:hypothetical protein